MSTAREREEARIRVRVILELLAERVYEHLGGTPFEGVLDGLPNLEEILGKVQRDAPNDDFREQLKRARIELAKKQEVIDARNERNMGRRAVMRLARHVDRYVAIEERGRQVDLESFVRAKAARDALDGAAGELGLSQRATWERFAAAVATAKQSDGWRRFPQALENAVNAVDWDGREADARERRSRFPNDSNRWSSADDEALRTLFSRLWDEGLEPPIRGPEQGNNVLEALSAELGRTPGAVWQRLVRKGLWSAVPAQNEEAIASRHRGLESSSGEGRPRSAARASARSMARAWYGRRRAEISNALTAFVRDGHDFLVIVSDSDRGFYVQFGRLRGADGEPAVFLYAEAVGNAHLRPEDRLSASQTGALQSLGWRPPEEAASTSPPLREPLETDNWWQIVHFFGEDVRHRDRIAEKALETLVDVFGYENGALEISSGSW